jgi:hypothetical protein
MIDVAASCPQPALLLPGVTGGQVTEVALLLAACRQAVQKLQGCDLIVVCGATPETKQYDVATPGPEAYYSPVAGKPAPLEVLPLSLAVGLRILDGAGPVELQGVADDASPAECAAFGAELAARSARSERIGLLVMADGSARRGEKAPGHFDDRAVAFDDGVADALASGDPEPLLALDPVLASDLLVAGRAAWQVLAGAFTGRRPQAQLTYSEAPFGVWYPVVTWTSVNEWAGPLGGQDR